MNNVFIYFIHIYLLYCIYYMLFVKGPENCHQSVCDQNKTIYLSIDLIQRVFNTQSHSCMPSPLAPDPIRVQSCVCYLF